ncbi:MAG: hypothetical protein H6706_11775 [Myxococcales bacterium]|nr:hypothetical protein [Myxococcales bacterium]
MTGEFLAAVEQALLAGTGRGLMLSAMDVQLARRWARAGVPAAVVVAGIERAFAHKPRTTRGLAYAAPAVEEAIRAWQALQVGGGTDDAAAVVEADAEVVEALGRLMNRLVDAGLRHQAPLRIVLRQVWKQLNSLKERCEHALESDPVGALEAIQREAVVAIWAVTPAEAQAAIDTEVEMSLRRDGRPAIDDEVRALRRWRGLRTQFGLPDLVLEMGGGW